MSPEFTIWSHWSTWDAFCWVHLGNSTTAALCGNGDTCGVWVRRWNLCPVTVWYVAWCISIPTRPWFPTPSSDWMVDALAWILKWILWMNFQSTNNSSIVIFLKGEYAVNILGFGSHSWFLFHQVQWLLNKKNIWRKRKKNKRESNNIIIPSQGFLLIIIRKKNNWFYWYCTTEKKYPEINEAILHERNILCEFLFSWLERNW